MKLFGFWFLLFLSVSFVLPDELSDNPIYQELLTQLSNHLEKLLNLRLQPNFHSISESCNTNNQQYPPLDTFQKVIGDIRRSCEEAYITVFTAEISSGKSTCLNALLGRPTPLLPTGDLPVTSSLTLIKALPSIQAGEGFFIVPPNQTHHDLGNLPKFTDQRVGGIGRLGEEVHVYLPEMEVTFLQPGYMLADSPGYNQNAHVDQKVAQMVSKCDAHVLIVRHDSGITRAMEESLTNYTFAGGKSLFVLINFWSNMYDTPVKGTLQDQQININYITKNIEDSIMKIYSRYSTLLPKPKIFSSCCLFSLMKVEGSLDNWIEANTNNLLLKERKKIIYHAVDQFTSFEKELKEFLSSTRAKEDRLNIVHHKIQNLQQESRKRFECWQTHTSSKVDELGGEIKQLGIHITKMNKMIDTLHARTNLEIEIKRGCDALVRILTKAAENVRKGNLGKVISEVVKKDWEDIKPNAELSPSQLELKKTTLATSLQQVLQEEMKKTGFDTDEARNLFINTKIFIENELEKIAKDAGWGDNYIVFKAAHNFGGVVDHNTYSPEVTALSNFVVDLVYGPTMTEGAPVAPAGAVVGGTVLYFTTLAGGIVAGPVLLGLAAGSVVGYTGYYLAKKTSLWLNPPDPKKDLIDNMKNSVEEYLTSPQFTNVFPKAAEAVFKNSWYQHINEMIVSASLDVEKLQEIMTQKKTFYGGIYAELGKIKESCDFFSCDKMKK